MKRRENTWRYGIYCFLAIAAFFLLMKLVGLEDVAWLRVVNIVFVIYFTNMLARKNVKDDANLDYLGALGSLFLANFLALALSIAGFYLYVKLIDPQFLLHFDGGIIWGSAKMSLWQIAASLFMEGMAGMVIVSFTSMQYWQGVHKVSEG